MSMSLLGIVFGISFFVVTQAQTSGFEVFFIRTILGTNGAIRVSDKFQDMDGTVSKVSYNGSESFLFRSRENARYIEGIEYPQLVREALREFPEVSGISEIIEGSAILDSGARKHTVQIHGLRIKDHIMVSELQNQLIQGSIDMLDTDRSGVLLGSSLAERLRLSQGDRVSLIGGTENQQLRVAGIFETGVSQIDKTRIYLDLSTARSFIGKPFGGSIFQVSIQAPEKAPELAAQMQETLGHRVVGWQEREKVWLEVFKALRLSSAITVSSILLLSGLGMFNVFAIMVIEKNRDIAILRSIGFTPRDVSAVFLWQGAIVLLGGIILGSLSGFLATYGISKIPLRIRGIFSTDSFVVNWDPSHYIWAIAIATVFVSVASWIPARRAAKIEPAKIIRESL
ncbi:MAG: ABC transporter permease [Opitutae bacterium]|nr:ABC transporter permease [Opitutae bacterium]|tara:strand:+ start:9459 stop:10652 length:1194 start_codon:yes stop_codon:yes gene_type:complete